MEVNGHLDEGRGRLAQVKARALAKLRAVFVFGVAAYNLVRLSEK